MCGIVGLCISGGGVEPETVIKMRDALTQHGPNDSVVWVLIEFQLWAKKYDII